MFGLFNKKNKHSNIDSDDSIGDLTELKVEKVDMNNIIQSIFQAESLYDKLKIKCHPDRFVNDELLMHKAENLYKEITENKRNFSKLQELQQIAEIELNITL